MQAGHDEVKGEEDFGMTGVGIGTRASGDGNSIEAERGAGHVMLFELLFIFDPFDPEKSDAEEHGKHETSDQEGAPQSLSSPNGQNHSQTAADQDGCVDTAEKSVDRLAGGSKISEIPAAIN